MNLSEIEKLLDEVMEIQEMEREYAWSYLACIFGLNMSESTKTRVMEHMKYIRTEKAIKNARKGN